MIKVKLLKTQISFLYFAGPALSFPVPAYIRSKELYKTYKRPFLAYQACCFTSVREILEETILT